MLPKISPLSSMFGQGNLLFALAKPLEACTPTGCECDADGITKCGCGGKTCLGCCKCQDCVCMEDDSKCTGCESCYWDYYSGDCYCADNSSKCNPGQLCCDGQCYDTSTQKCCSDGENKWICDIDKECCDGTCCDPDECCDNGTCVPKCTNTGQCDYGELPDGPYVQCIDNPVTHRCEELEGGVCYHVITIALNDAVYADCAPGCDKTRISACVEIITYRCKTHCALWVCDCLCEPDESTTRGDHYECD